MCTTNWCCVTFIYGLIRGIIGGLFGAPGAVCTTNINGIEGFFGAPRDAVNTTNNRDIEGLFEAPTGAIDTTNNGDIKGLFVALRGAFLPIFIGLINGPSGGAIFWMLVLH